MKHRQPALLTHPVFLACLFGLIVNDLYLKYAYHNWFTGKLSDFAGLFVFTVFLQVFFWKRKKTVSLFVALFFIWWKSPFADQALFFINNKLQIPAHRVIDYTDYTALSILPFTFWLKPLNRTYEFARRASLPFFQHIPSFTRTIATWISAIVSFTAFTATSLPMRKLTDDNQVSVEKRVRTKKTEKEIINTFERNGLSPRADTALFEKIWDASYYVKTKNINGADSMVPASLIGSGIYKKVGYGSAYTIPLLPLAKDTIQNVQLLIYDSSPTKNEVLIHSFQYKTDGIDSMYPDRYKAYISWKKFKRPLKRKFRNLLNGKK